MNNSGLILRREDCFAACMWNAQVIIPLSRCLRHDASLGKTIFKVNICVLLQWPSSNIWRRRGDLNSQSLSAAGLANLCCTVEPRLRSLERVSGIEPPFQEWRSCVFPLDDTRKLWRDGMDSNHRIRFWRPTSWPLDDRPAQFGAGAENRTPLVSVEG
jgi:hypothetical protein